MSTLGMPLKGTPLKALLDRRVLVGGEEVGGEGVVGRKEGAGRGGSSKREGGGSSREGEGEVGGGVGRNVVVDRGLERGCDL
jgi:hypothetical protein